MNILLNLPTDLFRHTMVFYNPQTKTAGLIKDMQEKLLLCEDNYFAANPIRWERKGFQATEEMCVMFSELVAYPPKPRLFYNWAVQQYICY